MDVFVHRRLDTGVPQQLLQDLGLHAALNRAGSIRMAQRVHPKGSNAGFFAQLIEVGVIGTVLNRFTGAIVYKDQIVHAEVHLPSGTAVRVFQNLLHGGRLFTGQALVIAALQNTICGIGQGDSAVAFHRFGRPGTPVLEVVAVLQTFIDGKSTLLPVDGIPSQTNQFTRAQPGFQQQSILPWSFTKSSVRISMRH